MRTIGSLREKVSKYGPEKTLYLDIYHAVNDTKNYLVLKGIIRIYARYLY